MQDAKRRALLFLVLALMLSAIAGYMFIEKLNAMGAGLGEEVTIYVATKNISTREPLKPEYFEEKIVPAKYVQESTVTDLNAIPIGDTPYPINSLVSVVPLSEGDLLTKSMLKPLSNLSSPDKRLVSVARSDRIGFDGPIAPNDLVDVIVSRSLGPKGNVTEVFMRNVPVVAVAPDKQGGVAGLGLEMTLDEATKFIHEQNFAITIRILKAPNSKNVSSKQPPQKIEVINNGHNLNAQKNKSPDTAPPMEEDHE